MINCCYNRSVQLEDLAKPSTVAKPDSCIGTTSSLSNYVSQQNRIVYVDTIGYGDVRFHQDCSSFIVFFHELISYSSIGFNWVFLCLRYQQITEEILIYFQTVQQLLGEKSLARCTIIFTHCAIEDMTLERFLEANKEHPEFVNIVQKVKSVFFGDMETENHFKQSSNSPVEFISWYDSELLKRREKFMKPILQQIDEMDEGLLELQQEWGTFYWTKFKSFLGFCWEKVFRQSNELSRLYKLTTKLKEDILLIIYYNECSICQELIVEIVDHSPRVCVTKCGHTFHYQCLQRAFAEKKECPNCRTNLRNLPERISAAVAGLKQIIDPLKFNVA